MKRNFAWGSKEKEVSNLIKCKRVCSNKKDKGGLWLCSIRHRNISLVLKWWWRYYLKRNNLWNQILQDKNGVELKTALSLVPHKPCSCSSLFYFIKQLRVCPTGIVSGSNFWLTLNNSWSVLDLEVWPVVRSKSLCSLTLYKSEDWVNWYSEDCKFTSRKCYDMLTNQDHNIHFQSNFLEK